MEELKKFRTQIDKNDKKFVQVLAKRFAITKEVGEYKKKHALPPQDKKREERMWQQRKKWAKQYGLDPDLIVQVFQTVVKKVRKKHRTIKHGK